MGLLAPKVLGVGGADAVEDSVLQAQMSTLSFVTPSHVGLPPATCAGPHWEAAIGALLRMAEYAAPADKMACVVACCAHLGTLVEPCDGSFVRLLALAVLRARPPRLYSQLEFVGRFVHPDRLWSPESGGPFTIARAAVQYLAHLDPVQLGVMRSTPRAGADAPAAQ